MCELDTLIDFTQYLDYREKAIRSGRLMPVGSERDLLGYYVLADKLNKKHSFVPESDEPCELSEPVIIPENIFFHLAQQPAYIAKKKADEISYVWDRLIEQFSNNIIAGTSVSLFGETPNATEAEQAIRSMALESRVSRRLLGSALIEAMERARKQAKDRYARVIFPGPNSADRTIAYVFLILAYQKIPLQDGYDQYRKVRVNILHAYCMWALYTNRNVSRAVGVGIDASSELTGLKGGSEDLVAVDIYEWTSELEIQARELAEEFDFMRHERVVNGYYKTFDYPLPLQPLADVGISRQQRRDRERAERKAARRKNP